MDISLLNFAIIFKNPTLSRRSNSANSKALLYHKLNLDIIKS